MIKSILLLFCLLFLSSCATIFNPKTQKVTISTQSPNASVYVDDVPVGKGDMLQLQLKRNGSAKSIKIKEDGYKDFNIVVSQIHKSPLFLLSIPTLLGIFADIGNKSYDYQRKMVTTPQRTLVVTRKAMQKHIYLTKASFDVPKEKLKFGYIGYKPYRRGSKNFYSYQSKENLVIDNTIFSDEMNTILKRNGFIDTTGTLLKSQTNTMYINVVVDSLMMKRINGHSELWDASYYVSEIGLTWEIQDIYQQTKFKFKTTSISDEYTGEKPEKLCLADALEKSFYELLAKLEVQDLLKPSTDSEEKNEVLKIAMPSAKVSNLETGIKATVTVVTDEGHGSGFCVSNDGYIVTNFHVIANSKKITIHLNNGKKVEAKIVRKNEFADLALLKISETVESAFVIPTELNFKIGDETYAIGTPKSIELGQTLTKGIISGKRNKDTQEVIQTDVSVNGGNSGGALVTKDGKLVGVVNAKLMGIGVEGIAFGIIAKDIIKYLNLSY